MSRFVVIALATALMFAELTLAEEPTTEMAFRNFAAVGDTNSVRELIDSGVDVDVQNRFGKTALMLAVETNSMETVVMLLARGADVNKRTVAGCTALTFAAENGHEAITALLLESGADITARTRAGWNALMIASRHGYAQLVDQLLNDIVCRSLKGSETQYSFGSVVRRLS